VCQWTLVSNAMFSISCEGHHVYLRVHLHGTCDLDIVIHLSGPSLITKRTQNSGNCSMHAPKFAICLADGSAYVLLLSCTT
jgi:hypothetical protein